MRRQKIAFQQNLLPISFPAPPQCQLDEKTKYFPVYFTSFGSLVGIDSIIEARRKKSGYILFVAKTYGTWKPEYRDGNIKISIKVSLVGNKTLECKENLKISFKEDELDEFCPGLYSYIKNSNPVNICK